MDGRELVVGSAWHDYGGSVTELDDINQKAPDKEVIFTETSIGTWNDGRNLSSRLLTDMKNLVYNTVTRKSKAVMVWNFMLDLNRGPNLDGGCQTCYGAVDIDQNDYHTLTYNSHYYVMAHASLAAQPGAHRIGLSVSNAPSDVSCVAFQNPDGSYGAIVFNQSGSSVQMSMGASSAAYARFTVPAKGIVTVVLGGEEEKDVRLGANVIPPTERSGTYRGTIATQQLESLSQNFIDNPEQWHIAPDFFWWDDTDSSLIFLPIDGSYEVEVDRVARTLLCSPVPAEEGLSVYICGPANSVGCPFFYPGSATLPQNAIAMAQMEQGLFQRTLVAGEQLNDAAVDFGFFLSSDLSTSFSGKTTAEHYLVYDQTLGSTLFGLGKGYSGHADGHIYKRQNNRHLEPGSLWTAVVDLREGLAGAPVFVREWEEPTGVEVLPQSMSVEGTGIYDLSGRRVSSVRKGIYIRGGRKLLVR